MVVGIYQPDGIAKFDSRVGRHAGQHDLVGRHAAATAARELVARAQHLAVLVQEGQGVGFLVTRADLVQLQCRAVLAAQLLKFCCHGLVLDGVCAVPVQRLVNLHDGDVKVHGTLPVRGQLACGRALRHFYLLDRITAAIPVPGGRGEE